MYQDQKSYLSEVNDASIPESQPTFAHTAQIVPTVDALSGLWNRETFFHKAKEMIGRSRSPLSLAILDLDKLKRANDLYGHTFGDSYIKSFSRLLQALVSPDCLIGRIGGDEFSILYKDSYGKSYLGALRSLSERLKNEFPNASTLGLGGVSIGIHSTSNTDTELEDLYEKADTALYAAKDSGRNIIKRYNEFVEQRYSIKHQIETVNEAEQNDRLEVAFQPIINLEDGKCAGYEALTRITLESGKRLLPTSFSKALRDRQCALRLSNYVLNDGISAWKILREGLMKGSRLSINVTEHDIADWKFFYVVANALENHHISGRELRLEISETAILDPNCEKVIQILQKFRSIGIEIAIDGFGTGFSGLTCLRKWPVDVIKIDYGFLADVSSSNREKQINRHICSLACSLGISVIAQGIEDEATLNIAKTDGVILGQGFYFGRPRHSSVALLLHRSAVASRSAREFLTTCRARV